MRLGDSCTPIKKESRTKMIVSVILTWSFNLRNHRKRNSRLRVRQQETRKMFWDFVRYQLKDTKKRRIFSHVFRVENFQSEILSERKLIFLHPGTRCLSRFSWGIPFLAWPEYADFCSIGALALGYKYDARIVKAVRSRVLVYD